MEEKKVLKYIGKIEAEVKNLKKEIKPKRAKIRGDPIVELY
jgi:hypothetical protein